MRPVDLRLLLGNDLVAALLPHQREPFLRLARRAGRRACDGAEMLLHQGARAFTLWTGRRAPLTIMREVLGSQNSD